MPDIKMKRGTLVRLRPGSRIVSTGGKYHIPRIKEASGSYYILGKPRKDGSILISPYPPGVVGAKYVVNTSDIWFLETNPKHPKRRTPSKSAIMPIILITTVGVIWLLSRNQ